MLKFLITVWSRIQSIKSKMFNAEREREQAKEQVQIYKGPPPGGA